MFPLASQVPYFCEELPPLTLSLQPWQAVREVQRGLCPPGHDGLRQNLWCLGSLPLRLECAPRSPWDLFTCDFWFNRSGVGPVILYFYGAQRQWCCCLSVDYILIARVGGGKRKFTPVIGIFPELLLGDCQGPCFAFWLEFNSCVFRMHRLSSFDSECCLANLLI